MDNQLETFGLRKHSEEVQEIMGQKPRVLVLWGNVLLVLLLMAFFLANAFVTFTEVRSFPITMQEGGISSLYVSAADVTKLKSGQRLWVSMEVYPQDVYGRFEARVMQVDLVPKEQGYGVKLKVCDVTDAGKRPKLLSGMRGTASLEESRQGFLRNLLMNRGN